MYFHTDNTEDAAWLADVLTQAVKHNRSIRIDTDDKGDLRVKVGAGMWYAPIPSTVDMSRSPGESPADRAAREVREGRIRSMKAQD